MKRMIKYPSTPQFREVVSNVKHAATYVGQDENGEPIYNPLAEMPTIEFYGSVKLHGTNAAFCLASNGDWWVQSRENIITPEKDNAGFAQFAYANNEVIRSMIIEYFSVLEREYNIKYDLDNKIVTLYGEWAGKGVQKGVGISEIEKSFFIFGLKLSPADSESTEPAIWIPHDFTSCRGHGDVTVLTSSINNIYNIYDFKQYRIKIDFNNPQAAINDMIAITEAVEASCPVAEDFGHVGTIGEGVVWSTIWNGQRLVYKVKGEKHSSSKVKKLASVDVEKLNSINEFVVYAVTENRLNQGIEQVFTANNERPDIKKAGDFIKWITSDVVKEELDTMTASGLEVKEVMPAVSKKAVAWFKKYLMDNL